MALFRPSELRQFLDSMGRGANRSLSQNFLVDGNVIKKIVDLIPAANHVIEIGPGPGVLTEELLARGLNVTAVEMDVEFARLLPRLGVVTVVEGDICKYALSKPSFVVGNIPYGISKEICVWMFSQRALVEGSVLMVQREFAEKLIAQPGDDGFGALSIQMQYLFDISIELQVAPTCFWPRPKATSAVIRCVKRAPQLTHAQEEIFFTSVRQAFCHRRKKISNVVEGCSLNLHVDQIGVHQWIEWIRSL